MENKKKIGEKGGKSYYLEIFEGNLNDLWALNLLEKHPLKITRRIDYRRKFLKFINNLDSCVIPQKEREKFAEKVRLFVRLTKCAHEILDGRDHLVLLQENCLQEILAMIPEEKSEDYNKGYEEGISYYRNFLRGKYSPKLYHLLEQSFKTYNKPDLF